MLFIYSLMMWGQFIMDKYIIINVNMFTKKSQIFVVAPNEDISQIGAYSIEELPNIITDLAHSANIYNVKIAGGQKFAQLIEFGIETNEMTKYNERKIKIEVI